MFNESVNDQLLAKFVKEISQGEYIFRQGDRGAAMYLILAGEVYLYHRGPKSEHLTEILRAGQAIGETTLFRSAQSSRTYTAQAKTKVSLLEVGPAEFKTIQAKMPDFHTKVIKLLSERLESCHSLINILQSDQPIEKIVLYLIFLAKQQPKDVKATFQPMDLQASLNIPLEKIEEVLHELENQKVISKSKEAIFTIEVPESLIDHLTELKQRLAA